MKLPPQRLPCVVVVVVVAVVVWTSEITVEATAEVECGFCLYFSAQGKGSPTSVSDRQRSCAAPCPAPSPVLQCEDDFQSSPSPTTQYIRTHTRLG